MQSGKHPFHALFGCSSSLLFAMSGTLLFPTTYVHLLVFCIFNQTDIFFLVKTVVDFLLQPAGLINFLWVLCKYWLLTVKGEVCCGSIHRRKTPTVYPSPAAIDNLELFAVTTNAKPKLLFIGFLYLLRFLSLLGFMSLLLSLLQWQSILLLLFDWLIVFCMASFWEAELLSFLIS